MLTNNTQQTLSPEECAGIFFKMNGAEFEPAFAIEQWSQIVQHKWRLSEKLRRDAGLRTSCTDFLDKDRINDYRV